MGHDLNLAPSEYEAEATNKCHYRYIQTQDFKKYCDVRKQADKGCGAILTLKVNLTLLKYTNTLISKCLSGNTHSINSTSITLNGSAP